MLKKSERKCPNPRNTHVCLRPFDKDTIPRLTNPPEGSLMEGSDASPDYVKQNDQSAGSKKQVHAPSTTGLQISQTKSAASRKESLKTLTKSSSRRSLRKKTSFKIKSSSAGKPQKITQDLGLYRATCSSTLKDSKFPKQVELEPGHNESDLFSAKMVCSYHHCSLHGHTHAPDPPPKRFLFRRHTERTPKSMETKGLSPDAVTSRVKKKPIQTGKRFPGIEPASEKASCSTGSSHVTDQKTSDFEVRTITNPVTEFYTGEPQEKENVTVARNLHMLHSGESANKNFKPIQNSPALEQIIREVVPNELKETADCCSAETTQDRCTFETTYTLLKGEEEFDSNAGIDIITATVTEIIKDEPSPLSEISTSEVSDEATKDSKGDFSTSCYTSEEHYASGKEKFDTSYPEVELNKKSILQRDCEAIEDNNVYTAINEVSKVHIQKNDHISMWHMIHQHMVLGLAEDAENQQHHPRFEDGRANDAKLLQGTNDPHLSPDISTSEMDVKNDRLYKYVNNC